MNKQKTSALIVGATHNHTLPCVVIAGLARDTSLLQPSLCARAFVMPVGGQRGHTLTTAFANILWKLQYSESVELWYFISRVAVMPAFPSTLWTELFAWWNISLTNIAAFVGHF